MEVLIAELVKVAGIFGMAWFSFWTAIPTGLVLGLHPIAVILVTSISYVSGILICVVPAQSVRQWVTKRFSKKLEDNIKHEGLIIQLWKRYGVIGFGLIAPMTTGAQLGAIIGIALNIPRKRLVVWMVVGVVAWSIGLTLITLTGVDLLQGVNN